jgi:hypothetical protein
MIPSLHCQSAAMAGRQGIFLLWASRSRWRCFLPLFLRQGKHRVLRGRQEASLGHFRRQTRTAGIIACRRGRYSISLWYEDSSSSTLVCLLLLGSSTEFLVFAPSARNAHAVHCTTVVVVQFFQSRQARQVYVLPTCNGLYVLLRLLLYGMLALSSYLHYHGVYY